MILKGDLASWIFDWGVFNCQPYR